MFKLMIIWNYLRLIMKGKNQKCWVISFYEISISRRISKGILIARRNEAEPSFNLALRG